jgi:hypothetical protein
LVEGSAAHGDPRLFVGCWGGRRMQAKGQHRHEDKQMRLHNFPLVT